MPDTYIGGMQGAVFNTILEVRVIDVVDDCGEGLFHHIAWQNCPIQIITVGAPGYLGIGEYILDIPGAPSPDQQFSRATILAYDGQVAVVRHYPHLLSPISVNTEMSVFLWRKQTSIAMPQRKRAGAFRARPFPSSDPRSSGVVFGGDILASVVRHECRRDQGDHGG